MVGCAGNGVVGIVRPCAPGFLVTVSFWTASMFGLTSSFSLQSYAALAGDSIYIRVLGNTVKIAVITTALSLLVSYPIALFLASLKGKAWPTQ